MTKESRTSVAALVSRSPSFISCTTPLRLALLAAPLLWAGCGDGSTAYSDAEVPEVAAPRGREPLVLAGPGITDAGVQEAVDSGGVEALWLRGCDRVTDAGIASLREAESLRKLTLGGCPGLTSAAYGALAAMPQLEELRLSFQPIDDEGLAALAASKSLRVLVLGFCDGATDAGIARLSECATLEQVGIASCAGITEEGATRLAQSLPDARVEYE